MPAFFVCSITRAYTDAPGYTLFICALAPGRRHEPLRGKAYPFGEAAPHLVDVILGFKNQFTREHVAEVEVELLIAWRTGIHHFDSGNHAGHVLPNATA